jgi:hypothetical protein
LKDKSDPDHLLPEEKHDGSVTMEKKGELATYKWP